MTDKTDAGLEAVTVGFSRKALESLLVVLNAAGGLTGVDFSVEVSQPGIATLVATERPA